MSAAALLSKASPTCLSCLRRSLVAGVGGSGFSEAGSYGSSVALTQIRTKTKGRPKDRGPVVRLLRDVEGFGRKDSIFYAPRGRMRNKWFPNKQAEYMTAARFAELGLTRDAIGERDSLFGLGDRLAKMAVQDKAAVVAKAETKRQQQTFAMKIEAPKPQEAANLLDALLPADLVFARQVNDQPRKPKPPPPAPEPQPVRSPLVASNAAVSSESAAATRSAEEQEQQQEEDEEENEDKTPRTPIFGSVTTTDVAVLIRQLLQGHPQASLIAIPEKLIHIVGVPGAKVQALGRWDVSISIPGGEDEGVEPIRRVLEVVNEDDPRWGWRLGAGEAEANAHGKGADGQPPAAA